MYKIRLKDGIEYGVYWCGAADGVLNAAIVSDGTMSELAAVFDYTDNTAHIEYEYDGSVNVYDGYTKLITIMDRREQSGELIISLKKTSGEG